MEDFFLTDDQLMEKLKKSDDKQILSLLRLLTPEFTIAIDKKRFDFIAKTKPRYVDPKFLDRGSVTRVSQASPNIRKTITEHREKVSKGYPIRIIRG